MICDLPSHWVICFFNEALDVAHSQALRDRLEAPLRNGVVLCWPFCNASLSDDARPPKPLGDLFLKRGAGRSRRSPISCFLLLFSGVNDADFASGVVPRWPFCYASSFPTMRDLPSHWSICFSTLLFHLVVRHGEIVRSTRKARIKLYSFFKRDFVLASDMREHTLGHLRRFVISALERQELSNVVLEMPSLICLDCAVVELLEMTFLICLD
jgi:hypothetical protein